ncbi:NgoMIV family type II restriction endonuclease [Glycomyces harbinensis]|uniref:NgoMIV restriction enzyme n=1 Tax=Glycomyces harbinensis TaxID=58114 RepID=A0A1G7DV97_9ACTN|nr:NgoMIV family type II restriction endonuclease [Glycomyces harbinensis]SDE55378.1 NgoMIV restriction enzyme [Glycomyces harbinensis]
MVAPEWLRPLLYYKKTNNRKSIEVVGSPAAPNISDVDNQQSLAIAHDVYRSIGVEIELEVREGEKGNSLGSPLEAAVREHLRERLPEGTFRRFGEQLPNNPAGPLKVADIDSGWVVGSEKIEVFEQYRHLADMAKLFAEQPSLRTLLGSDYQIKPDVTVGKELAGVRMLHAVVSCKWTMRSDRAQNVRQEFKQLIVARRGRTPHLVAVTAEPFPTRLLALTRGTGETDAVYHVAFEEMESAVRAHGNKEQRNAWTEMREQRRLKDFNHLVDDLTTA